MTRLVPARADSLPLFSYKLSVAMLALVLVGCSDGLAAMCPGDRLATLSCLLAHGLPYAFTL